MTPTNDVAPELPRQRCGAPEINFVTQNVNQVISSSKLALYNTRPAAKDSQNGTLRLPKWAPRTPANLPVQESGGVRG